MVLQELLLSGRLTTHAATSSVKGNNRLSSVEVLDGDYGFAKKNKKNNKQKDSYFANVVNLSFCLRSCLSSTSTLIINIYIYI